MSTTMVSRTRGIIGKLMKLLANRQVTHILDPHVHDQLYIYIAPIKLTIEIPPGHPALKSIQTKMSLKLCQLTEEDKTSIMIPSKQIWAVVDVFVTQPLNIDGYLQMFKNSNRLGDFPPLNALNIAYPVRHTLLLPPPELTVFGPGEVLEVYFVPLGANNSTNTITENATIDVIILDFTYTKLPDDEVSMIAYDMQLPNNILK